MFKNIASPISDSDEIKSILAWKLADISNEVIDCSISELKIKNIVDRLSAFSDSNSIIWDFLIEIDIRKNSNLLDVINNLRVNGFNFLLILYLFSESDVRDFMVIEWVKLSREDIFLWEMLSAMKIEWDMEIKNFLECKKYIEIIYKWEKPDFNAISEINWKSFLEFLLSTYSYYTQFKDWINWWKLLSNIIYDFISHLLNNNKLRFDGEKTINFIDELSNWLKDLEFSKWMYVIKKIIIDYINESENRALNTNVARALNAYNSQALLVFNQ